MHLADPKGFHRFLETDLEHAGVVPLAVISAGNCTLVPGSQAASVQAGRKEGWATFQPGASLTNPAHRTCPSFRKGAGLIPSNLCGGWICSPEHISSTATLLKRSVFTASSLSVPLLFLILSGEHFIHSWAQPHVSVCLRPEIKFHF